jgi:hypothetical protein
MDLATCPDEQVGPALINLQRHGIPPTSNIASHLQAASAERQEFIIQRAIQVLNPMECEDLFVSYCPPGMLQRVLTAMAQQGRWSCVGHVLETRKGVITHAHQWVLVDCFHDDANDLFTKHVLPHLSLPAESILQRFVEREKWQGVHLMLQHMHGSPDYKAYKAARDWSIDQACGRVGGHMFYKFEFEFEFEFLV